MSCRIMITYERVGASARKNARRVGALALLAALGCQQPKPAASPKYPASPADQKVGLREHHCGPDPAPPAAAASPPAKASYHDLPRTVRVRLAPPPAEPMTLPLGLTLPPQGAFQRFFGRLAALEKGERRRVRVTVWGASHIAGEAFTGELRRRFQAEFGDGGPGFVIPGRPWRSYRHSSLRFGEEGRWRSERIWTRYTRRHRQPRDDLFGLGGISVHTRWDASAWLELRKRRPLGAMDLYYLRQPRGGRLDIVVGSKRLQRVLTAARRKKQPGFARVVLPPGTRRVALQAKGGEVRFYGVDLQSGRPGVVVDALGINGGRADRLLQWNEEMMSAQIARLAPDLMVLAYGSNSVDNKQLTPARLSKSLDGVLQRMRRLAPEADCLLIGPADQARREEGEDWCVPANLGWIIDAQRRAAHARGCAYWDWREVMGGKDSVFAATSAEPPRVRKDHLHFTGRGYTLYASALHASLMALRKRLAARANNK